MKLALGTVQFGLDYGVSNNHGQVNSSEITAILKLAQSVGIDTLDTASVYGNSEQILGEQLSTFGDNTEKLNSSFKIVSKIPALKNDEIKINHYLDQSLDHLKQNQLEVVLFHQVNDLIDSPFNQQRFDNLMSEKKQGKINKVGISVYKPEQLNYCVNHYKIDLVQLPLNCLDQRFIQTQWLEKLTKAKIEVHCRSLFLQGLLLMDISKLANYFKPYKPYLMKFYNMTKQLNVSPLALSLAIGCKNTAISKMVVGCCNTTQLEEIVEAYEVALTIDANLSLLACNDEQLLIPSNWKLGGK